MINLFDIPPGDSSVKYLSTLFGSMNGVIPYADSTSGTLLGTMFQTFNSVVLAVGALIVLYVTLVSIVSTAHEGEFMGQKWKSIWIPIRMVIGIAALVPFSSGFSGLQIVMMWIIVQGIGAADTLWNTALGYISGGQSTIAQLTLPSAGASQAFQGLFQGLVCDISARVNVATPNDGGAPYYCYEKGQSSSGGSFCSAGGFTPFTPNSASYSLGPNGACGQLELCSSQSCTDNSLACATCKAQSSAVAAVVSVLAPIAGSLVQADYTYRQFVTQSYNTPNNSQWSWIYSYCSKASPAIPQDECCVRGATAAPDQTCQSGSAFFPTSGSNNQNANNDAVTKLFWPYAPGLQQVVQNSDIIALATQSYNTAMNQAFSEYIAQQGQQDISGELADAQATGWFFAGAYYYQIAGMNSSNMTATMPNINYTQADPSSNSSSALNGYRNNYAAAGALLGVAAAAGGNAAGLAQTAPELQGVSTAINSSLTDVNSGFMTSIDPTSGTNPLVGMQAWGNAMLITAEVLFLAIVAAALIMFLLGYLSIWVYGTGIMNPVGPAMSGVFFILLPAIIALMSFLIAFGGLLAVYTPMIPYIIFTFGTIGWLTSTIEAMVAGPLVAVGILSPSNQHELLGAASGGLMLMFNVFLRPSLMIFGLMAGMLMATIVVQMINTVFWEVMMSTGLNPIINILGWFLFLGLYVFLVLGALNKAFALIYILPQNVIRWIGGQAESYGEEGSLAEVKGGHEKVSSGISAKGEQAGGAMSESMEKYATKSAAKRKKQSGTAEIKGK